MERMWFASWVAQGAGGTNSPGRRAGGKARQLAPRALARVRTCSACRAWIADAWPDPATVPTAAGEDLDGGRIAIAGWHEVRNAACAPRRRVLPARSLRWLCSRGAVTGREGWRGTRGAPGIRGRGTRIQPRKISS
jgi:hypothetical protein